MCGERGGGLLEIATPVTFFPLLTFSNVIPVVVYRFCWILTINSDCIRKRY